MKNGVIYFKTYSTNIFLVVEINYFKAEFKD